MAKAALSEHKTSKNWASLLFWQSLLVLFGCSFLLWRNLDTGRANFVLITIVLTLCISLPIVWYWLQSAVSNLGTIAVLGTVFMTGFLGSFVFEFAWITPFYTTVRWVAPLILLVAALFGFLSSSAITKHLMEGWGTASPFLLLFIGYSLLSMSYSSAPLTTLGRVVTFTAITFGMSYGLTNVITTRARLENLLICLGVLLAIVVLPGELYILQPNSTIGWHSSGRFRSTFWNPVTLAHLCVIVLPLYWWLAIRPNRAKRYRIIALTMCGILLLNIYLAGSRGGVLGLVAVALPLIWYSVGNRARFLLYTTIFLLFTFAIAFGLENINLFFTRGANLTDNYYFYSGRLVGWLYAIELFTDSPLLGSGFGTIGDIDAVLIQQQVSTSSATAFLRLSNVYLELLASVGIIGSSLFLLILYKLFSTLARNIQHTASDTRSELFLVMVMATFIGGLVLNITETWMISAGSPYAMYYWLVLFLGVRLTRMNQAI